MAFLSRRCCQQTIQTLRYTPRHATLRSLTHPRAARVRLMASSKAAPQAGVSLESNEDVVYTAIVWAVQHGLVYGLGASAPDGHVVHAPFAVYPCPYPRQQFNKAVSVMPAFSKLVDAVSRDERYLEETLAQAAQYDDFTAKLLEVLAASRPAREIQQQQGSLMSLGVHRSDYMLDAPSGSLLQVELNTIASSFGCLSAITARLHKYLLSRVDIPGMSEDALPPNDAMDGIAAGLAAGVAAYGTPGAVLVMVVQPGERNAFDQQWLQTTLWEQHRILTLRRTLKELAESAEVNESGDLIVSGRVAAVVYFRAGYTPDDYPSEVEWQARLKLEQSKAAKCPTVAYQLAGAKKIQQDLAKPGQLEKFVPDAQEAGALRSHFAGLWSLDDLQDPETMQIVQQAVSTPDDYVLKPQREGGGNNLYGDELKQKLTEGKGLSAYILMQRIKPSPNNSILVRGGQWSDVETLSELGIYGTFLRKGEAVLLNEAVGHLVRTKTSSSNEGGVAAGFAVLDSPYLV